jgi:hypothetical protein
MDERLQEGPVFTPRLRPRFLEEVVAFEVHLPVEELGSPEEERSLDHPGMVSRGTSLRK